jgi:hypothetical protein
MGAVSMWFTPYSCNSVHPPIFESDRQVAGQSKQEFKANILMNTCGVNDLVAGAKEIQEHLKMTDGFCRFCGYWKAFGESRGRMFIGDV